ncbi:MAG: ATP-binding protein [Actinomycetes bacterium]
MTIPPAGPLTLFFSDIEGSTRLLQEVGDERWAACLADYARAVRGVFHAHGGTEVDSQGDGFFAVFDSVVDGAAAAASVQRLASAPPWGDVPIGTRIGLHTGRPLFAGGRFFGLDVHRAARVMAAGHGGQTLLSDQAARSLRRHEPEGTSIRDMGAHRLKDLAEPQHLYQLSVNQLPSTFPPIKSLSNRPTNLPLRVTSFIGRTSELGELSLLLCDAGSRLVTVTGPGGVGKTRLAVQACAEVIDKFPDGVFYVPLAPLQDPALIPSAVASAIGLRTASNRAIEDALLDYLRDRHLLLLLDNFEHLVAGAALISRWLGHASELTVLTTSRAPLRLSGETLLPVEPLSLNLPEDSHGTSEAAALFVERARSADPDFLPDESDLRTVEQICAKLDALPLAIELASARVRALPLATLLERLDHRLNVLTGGYRDADTRQHTLRTTIAWSVDLLDPSMQIFFRRLSVFVGGATLDSIQVVLDPARELRIDDVDGVTSLVEHSLLRRWTHRDGQPRFRMLESVREYALEQLAAEGEAGLVGDHYVDYYLKKAQLLPPARDEGRATPVLHMIDADIDNFRGALELAIGRGLVDRSMQLVNALYFYLAMRSPREGERWFAAVAALAPTEPQTPAGALFLAYQAEWPRFRGEWDLAYAMKHRAREAAERLGQVHVMTRAEYDLGSIEIERNNLAEAKAWLAQSLARAKKIDAPSRYVISCLGGLADIAERRGNLGLARELLEDGLGRARESQEGESLAISLMSLGDIDRQLGNPARARDLCCEAITVAGDYGLESLVGPGLDCAARALVDLDEPLSAALLWGCEAAIVEASGRPRWDQEQYSATVLRARSMTPEPDFDAAWAEGRTLEPRAAVGSCQAQP